MNVFLTRHHDPMFPHPAMKPIIVIMTLVILPIAILQAQIPKTYRLGGADLPHLPPSNVINDIIAQGDTVWIGSNRGPSYTADAGLSWKNLANSVTFDDKSVSALALRNNQIWVATSYETTFDNVTYQTGHGLHYSLDRGATWTFIPQPVDTGKVDTLLYGKNKIPALAVTVPQTNLTFDFAITSNSVWIASYGGMLRKSTDLGRTWQRIILPPDFLNKISPNDSLSFALTNVDLYSRRDSSQITDTIPGNLNHRVFSVFATDDSTIWVGTANGINKSTDGGVSWRKFNHHNQFKPISGNFVVAINEQRSKAKRILWAATVNAEDPDEKRGVSFSEDGGNTWSTALLGEFAHNIAFKDSIVYVASDGGLYRSADYGSNWLRTGTIYDPVSLQRFGSSTIYAVAAQGDTIWVGGIDGLAYTIDSPSQPFGSVWHIFRTYQPIGNAAQTYSYPLPFSPAKEVVRIHFSMQGRAATVSIRIFDFAMQPVKTLLRNAMRSGALEHDEVWDGRDDLGRRVANGVYFFRVEIEGGEPLWGKILVLQ
jgi:ligand-binding sensor domain-containing protein